MGKSPKATGIYVAALVLPMCNLVACHNENSDTASTASELVFGSGVTTEKEVKEKLASCRKKGRRACAMPGNGCTRYSEGYGKSACMLDCKDIKGDALSSCGELVSYCKNSNGTCVKNEDKINHFLYEESNVRCLLQSSDDCYDHFNSCTEYNKDGKNEFCAYACYSITNKYTCEQAEYCRWPQESENASHKCVRNEKLFTEKIQIKTEFTGMRKIIYDKKAEECAKKTFCSALGNGCTEKDDSCVPDCNDIGDLYTCKDHAGHCKIDWVGWPTNEYRCVPN
ncbi:MAG: hypothetical protein AAF471_03450 [Myxococcota bacterium]